MMTKQRFIRMLRRYAPELMHLSTEDIRVLVLSHETLFQRSDYKYTVRLAEIYEKHDAPYIPGISEGPYKTYVGWRLQIRKRGWWEHDDGFHNYHIYHEIHGLALGSREDAIDVLLEAKKI